jgi:hypothetical protein
MARFVVAIGIGLIGVAVTLARPASAEDEVTAAEAEPPEPPPPSRPPPPVVVILAPPPPEPLPPQETPPAEEPEPSSAKVHVRGFEISLGALFFRPSLGHVAFNGSGAPVNGGPRQTFHHAGRELGVDSPALWGGELSIHYAWTYFAAGVTGFVAGHVGTMDTAPVPSGSPAAMLVNRNALMAYGGGLELAAIVPFEHVAVRPGAVLGIRGFTLPLVGYAQTTCRTKGGTRPCSETATTEPQPFIEPRLRVEITPGERSQISFGGYVGVDALGGSTPTGGLFFVVHNAQR